jgi:hypothetical protein
LRPTGAPAVALRVFQSLFGLWSGPRFSNRARCWPFNPSRPLPCCRIDNCSAETLHVQQVGCLDEEDVLAPYSCLPYTWDEPSAPNKVR